MGFTHHFTQHHLSLLTALAGKFYHTMLSVQEDLAAIEEVYLEDVVAQSKHYRMFCLQPLFYVY